jgi:subtilisin family serine protease
MRLGYLLSVLTLAGLISGCSLTAPAPTDTAPTDTADAPHPHDDDELLVLDPPADYVRHLPDLGLEVIDVTDLPGIGSKLYHLRILDGAHPHHARGKHDERFADVLVDVHHHFQHHAAKADKSYTPRAAAQWTAASAACGNGLRIGIVDNLVDTTHPAFAGAKIVHRSFHLKGEQLARTSHGTAVTAIVAGSSQWHGLLPGAEIYHANVFHRGKKGKAVGSSKSIVQAIDWMIHQKVPIVNFSIGGGRNKLIEKAIAHASATGMILVASSGNRGPFSKKKIYPGAYDQVIAVTAVDRFERSARFATAGDYIDFAAPGVGLWTAVPGGGKAMSGTSFAAPVVTAYAAAAQQRLGLKTADDIRAYFRKHTKDRGEPGRDRYTGWGLVQLPPLCS